MAGDKIAQTYARMLLEASYKNDISNDESPASKAYRRDLEAHHEMEQERKAREEEDDHVGRKINRDYDHKQSMINYHKNALNNMRPDPNTFHMDRTSPKDRMKKEDLHRSAIAYYKGDKTALTQDQHNELADMHRRAAAKLREPVMHANQKSARAAEDQARFHEEAAEHHDKQGGGRYGRINTLKRTASRPNINDIINSPKHNSNDDLDR
jgi:hypothetical protein